MAASSPRGREPPPWTVGSPVAAVSTTWTAHQLPRSSDTTDAETTVRYTAIRPINPDHVRPRVASRLTASWPPVQPAPKRERRHDRKRQGVPVRKWRPRPVRRTPDRASTGPRQWRTRPWQGITPERARIYRQGTNLRDRRTGRAVPGVHHLRQLSRDGRSSCGTTTSTRAGETGRSTPRRTSPPRRVSRHPAGLSWPNDRSTPTLAGCEGRREHSDPRPRRGWPGVAGRRDRRAAGGRDCGNHEIRHHRLEPPGAGCGCPPNRALRQQAWMAGPRHAVLVEP